MNNNVQVLETALGKILNKESVIYFLTYDTKNNPRAAIKYIYDMALALKNEGYNAKILVEDKTYTTVDIWLGDTYQNIEIVSIKEDKPQLSIEDIIVVPEYYSNAMEGLANVKSVKIVLVQQKDFIFETLSIGSRWRDFGFDKCITTTNTAKKFISEYFPETLVHVIPPFIGDNFKPTEKPINPFVSISCKDRTIHRKIISQFYLKFPQLRWITFRDMVQLTYEEFSDALKECMVSVWVDDDSTFGTFPLESMKCGVPVIGKVPNTEPEWIGENGIWTYDVNKIAELIGTYVMAWISGEELTKEVKDNMRNTTLPYTKDIHTAGTLSVFKSLLSIRKESIKSAIEKFKTEEVI